MTTPITTPRPQSAAIVRPVRLERSCADRRRFQTGWRPAVRYAVAGLVGSAILAPLVFAADAFIVSQRKREFWPNDLKLTRGSVVHIVNDDRVTHHVFIKHKSMKFDSGEQPVGKTVELIFDKKGLFAVRCAIHPLMRLSIEVN